MGGGPEQAFLRVKTGMRGEVSCVDIWGQSLPGPGEGKSQGSEEGAYLSGSRESKVSGVGAEGMRREHGSRGMGGRETTP